MIFVYAFIILLIFSQYLFTFLDRASQSVAQVGLELLEVFIT